MTTIEASIETSKSTIKTETTQMTESEKEESAITIKITKTDETVQKLETETQKIEEEASKSEQSTTSESSSKTTI